MIAAPAVELRGLAKSFGAVAANAGVDLVVRPGTIHAVIGENGAGKSTAMKMLYGIYRPDAGEFLVDGKVRVWATPSDAIAAGIGMVHQHFMLAGPYTALENVVVGAEGTGAFGRIDFASARARCEELARAHGLEVPLDSPVEELAVGVQQRLEILKALYRSARILILDEPTAVLTPQETAALFANLRKLRDEGKTILIITHKLKEVMAVADHVTCFRAGRVVGDRPVAGTSPGELADMMVGRKVNLTVEAPPAPRLGEPALELREVRAFESRGAACLAGVSLSVRGGEVVGIAGIEGNGQSELLRFLLHPTECDASGDYRCLGKDASRLSAREIRALGVGLVPEDRHREGLLLERPVEENFLLGLQRRFSRGGLVARAELRAAATRAIEEYDVRPPSLTVAVAGLSGGNQQKLIIARELEPKPRLLIAAQPTRGVDVGAIEFIHRRLLDARAAGAAVLLVSSELDEILALSDRIAVIYAGKIVAELARGEATEQRLGLLMGGAHG